jgi:hypothetical protein
MIMSFCPSCGAPLRVLSATLGVLHCRRGHHWTKQGRCLNA